MTIDEFNDLELSSFDIIEITMNNGETRREILYQGHAYAGCPERRSYPDNNIIPATPAQIVILGNSVLGTSGIEVEHILEVELIGNLND